MKISDQYDVLTRPTPFQIQGYKTPLIYQDPLKQIQYRKNMDYKHKPPQKKLPSQKKLKNCFFDEITKCFKNNPSPSVYQTQGNMLKSTNKGTSLKNKVNPKIKKNTFIDQIERQQQLRKKPGVCKYNLLTLTSFGPKSKHQAVRDKVNPQKPHALDDFYVLASETPGPGSHNPHVEIKKVKKNQTNPKFFKKKHEKQEKKLRRVQSATLGPSSYRPISSNTFDSLKKQFQNKTASRWSHGQIQIRKGSQSEMKSPGPGQYQIINQWSPVKSSGNWRATSKSSKQIGHVNLLGKTIKSAKSMSIYRN